MSIEKLINRTENLLFNNRLTVLIVFLLASIFLSYQASQIKLDASFTKNIPLNHEYMKTYLKHRENFGGANNVLISVCNNDGDIFNADFFTTLRAVHDQVFFIPGINRTQVKSLFSPSTRFIEVVEDGFSGGPVIPADFRADDYGLAIVKGNIEKAGIVGRTISNDYSCAMVTSSLMEIDPQTGEKLDTIKVADQLESQLRAQYEHDNISIHIIGFSKMVGDVANGAKGVVLFFIVAIVITSIMVFLFCRSIKLTVLPILCSLVSVVWQMGMLSYMGFGLDPMSILVPFLVFAIGVSHGVQMINAINKNINKKLSAKVAAQLSCRALLLPGVIALLSDTIGFLTLLSIDIGIIRELAITASLGVAMIILTNLILLPILASFLTLTAKNNEHTAAKTQTMWLRFSICAQPKVAVIILSITSLLFIAGLYFSQHMKIGELHEGAPALHADSRYNLDTALITDKYEITVDYISIIAETYEDACTYHETLSVIEEFEWRLNNVKGVESTISLSTVAKVVNAGFNEGNAKWRALPRNEHALVQSIARVPTSSGLLNSNCSVMPVILFLQDHKAETIERVIQAVKEVSLELSNARIQFKLASGPVGVMAATNEAVEAAQLPMMLYVYSAVIILCLISFRSMRSTISVVLPLFVVSVLAQWLMTVLNIGLTVSTLPVIALGVGIGVDYGIYILSTMNTRLNQGDSLYRAYLSALEERGSAVLITGFTLAIGVSTWLFSDLKFQVDMGILLTFMFLVNMLAAIIILPAIASLLWRKPKKVNT